MATRASSQHVCCAAASAERDALLACPRCGVRGHQVGDETVRSILPADSAATLLGANRWFCGTPGCPVLYYGAAGQLVGVERSRVRVGFKEDDGPTTLCYCFGYTLADVREEIARTGSCSIPPRVAAEVRAGRCACEMMNPSGRCCLGELNAAVKREVELQGGRNRGS